MSLLQKYYDVQSQSRKREMIFRKDELNEIENKLVVFPEISKKKENGDKSWSKYELNFISNVSKNFRINSIHMRETARDYLKEYKFKPNSKNCAPTNFSRDFDTKTLSQKLTPIVLKLRSIPRNKMALNQSSKTHLTKEESLTSNKISSVLVETAFSQNKLLSIQKSVASHSMRTSINGNLIKAINRKSTDSGNQQITVEESDEEKEENFSEISSQKLDNNQTKTDESLENQDDENIQINVGCMEKSTKNFISEENNSNNFKKMRRISINVMFEEIPRLSFILKEYPDESEPSDFFKQKFSLYHPHIVYIRKLWAINSMLSNYFMSISHEFEIRSFRVELAIKGEPSKFAWLPFGVCYFLKNCPKVVLLFLVKELLTKASIDEKTDFPFFVSFEEFNKTIIKLSNEVEVENIAASFANKGTTRKSIFCSQKINDLIGSEDEQEKNPTQKNESEAASNSENSKSNQSKVTGQSNQSDKQKKRKKSRKSDVKVDNIKSIKSHESVLKHGTHEKIDETNSIDVDSSDQESKSEDSFEEDEFISKNMFEMKNSEIFIKNTKHRISIEEPCLISRTGKNKVLDEEEIYLFFKNPSGFKVNFNI